jgi:hypothetical protein
MMGARPCEVANAKVKNGGPLNELEFHRCLVSAGTSFRSAQAQKRRGAFGVGILHIPAGVPVCLEDYFMRPVGETRPRPHHALHGTQECSRVTLLSSSGLPISSTADLEETLGWKSPAEKLAEVVASTG